MHCRIANRNSVSVLCSCGSESEAASNVRNRKVRKGPVRLREPQIPAAGRVECVCQVIAEPRTDPEKNVRNRVVIDFGRHRNLSYEQKGIRARGARQQRQ